MAGDNGFRGFFENLEKVSKEDLGMAARKAMLDTNIFNLDKFLDLSDKAKILYFALGRDANICGVIQGCGMTVRAVGAHPEPVRRRKSLRR